MKLAKCIAADAVLLDIEVNNKTDLLKIMSGVIAGGKVARDSKLTAESIYDGILYRESQGSTGIGNALGFPHTRFPGLKEIAVCLAVLKTPIDFGAVDRQPVKVVTMIVVPSENPMLAVKIMSGVAKVFNDRRMREHLDLVRSGEELIAIMESSDFDLDVSVNAGDIMREPILTFPPDLPLKEATWQMSLHDMSSVPVIDASSRLLGEVSCGQLFKIGIPDFFIQLRNTSFIRDFDPFEKYFYEEAHSTVKDVMDSDICRLVASSTLMEVVYELAVHNRKKIYIVDNDTLVGIIDQTLVLERIINF